MIDIAAIGERKFITTKKSNMDIEIFPYLTEKLQNLNINVTGCYEGNPIDLMKNHYLQHWCYESTNTAIVFFDDEDFIERGSITVYPNERFSHAWIVFTFKKQKYILDLALDVLCKKELYDSLFEPKIEGYSSSLTTKDYLIQKLLNPPVEKHSKAGMEFIKKLERFSGESSKNPSKEVHIFGSNCIYDPMYRGNVGYIGSVENGKIKKLSAYFYDPRG